MKKFKKITSIFVCAIFALFTINLGCSKAYASGMDKPATPSISHNNWDGKSSFDITMNMWWGQNGTECKLYENGKVIDSIKLNSNSPNAQSAIFHLKNKAKGNYRYKVALINQAGSSESSEITVAVTEGDGSGNVVEKPAVPTGLKGVAKGTNSIEVTWNLVNSANSYDLEVDGKIMSNVKTPYINGNLLQDSMHKYRVRAVNEGGSSEWSNVISVKTEKETVTPPVVPPVQPPVEPPVTPPTTGGDGLPSKVLIGYWHNFDNGSTATHLKDTSLNFDLIDVAFAESMPDEATMIFKPYNASPQDFKKEIEYLQSKGKKVVLSIGGQNGRLHLDTKEKEDTFVKTMTAIIDQYGFDGMDIDLEGGTVSLGAGDVDINNPSTPKVKHLISGIKRICKAKGKNFILTMAPEVTYVQGGLIAYAGPWGAYLPVINALRDELTILHVQHYNHGSEEALDGNTYTQGTADFQVAMAEMMITGFDVGRNPNNHFKGLPASKVAIGLPACSNAAGGGYTDENEVIKALDYLINGKDFGGKYKLRNPKGYKDFRGVMTWSTNWDETVNFKFSNAYRHYFDSLGR